MATYKSISSGIWDDKDTWESVDPDLIYLMGSSDDYIDLVGDLSGHLFSGTKIRVEGNGTPANDGLYDISSVNVIGGTLTVIRTVQHTIQGGNGGSLYYRNIPDYGDSVVITGGYQVTLRQGVILSLIDTVEINAGELIQENPTETVLSVDSAINLRASGPVYLTNVRCSATVIFSPTVGTGTTINGCFLNLVNIRNSISATLTIIDTVSTGIALQNTASITVTATGSSIQYVYDDNVESYGQQCTWSGGTITNTLQMIKNNWDLSNCTVYILNANSDRSYNLNGGVTFGSIDTGVSPLILNMLGTNTVYKNTDITFDAAGLTFNNSGTLIFDNPGYTIYFTGNTQHLLGPGPGTYIVRSPVSLQGTTPEVDGIWKLYDNLNIASALSVDSDAQLQIYSRGIATLTLAGSVLVTYNGTVFRTFNVPT